MSAADSVRERYELAKAKVQILRQTLNQKRASLLDTNVASLAQSERSKPVGVNNLSFKCVRTLQGHTGKVFALDWAYRETSRIVSASQDGRIIVSNAISSQKTHSFKLPCAWDVAAAISPTGNMVACGGLDNVCSIFNLGSVPDKEDNLSMSGTLTSIRAISRVVNIYQPKKNTS